MTSIERRKFVAGIEADVEAGIEDGTDARCRMCTELIEYDDLRAWIPHGLCHWCNEWHDAQEGTDR